MKRILYLLIVMVVALAFISDSKPAAAAEQKINFNYTNVMNRDYDISDYAISSSSSAFIINIEGKLITYLLENSKDIKLSFNNEKFITIPAASLNTSEYISMQKTGNAFTVQLELDLTKENAIYDYLSENELNNQGLYCNPKLSFEISGKIISNGDQKYDLKDFAAPVTITLPYSWGADTYMPVTQNETMLRYYFIDTDVFENYTYSLIGGSVDKDKDQLTTGFTKLGLYCGMSSAKHTSSSNDAENGSDPSSSASQTGFNDLSGHWAENDIIYLQRKNVILSKSGDYLPSKNITRAEFAVYITRILSLPASKTAEGKFSDLNKDAYYYQAVIMAASNGLISGKSDTIFAPSAEITRQEMSALMMRVLQRMDKVPQDTTSVLSNFSDHKGISSWAKLSCAAVVRAGLIAGRDGGKFCAEEITTRAEAAVILARLYRFIYE